LTDPKGVNVMANCPTMTCTSHWLCCISNFITLEWG